MNEKQLTPEDQINLGGLKGFLVSVLKVIFDLIFFTILVITKKKWIIVVGLLVGIGGGIAYYYSQKPVFEASMIVQFNKLNKKTYAEVLKQLNILCRSGSTNKLAAELHTSDSLARNMLFITPQTINDEPLEKDTSTKIYQPFKITIGMLNNEYADSLQYALINYLNNLPYLKKLAEIDIKNNTERLKYIESDLAKLDSLKTEFNRFLATSRISATVYNDAINPAEIYNHSNRLVLQREETQRLLYLDNTAVSLIDGFKVTMLPKSIRLLNSLFIIGGIGLFTGFLVGLLITTKEKVMQ